MRLGDLVSDALAGLLQRPAQAAATVVGTAVGIGTLVATVGIASTAGDQVVAEVGGLAPTAIRVDLTQSADPTIRPELTWDATARVGGIRGVAAVGALIEVTRGVQVHTAPVASYASLAADVRVFAGSPGLLAATGATLVAGREFDSGHVRRADAVALVGAAAASRLGLRTGASQEAIFLGDTPVVVIGVYAPGPAAPELSTAVLVPPGFAREQLGVSGPNRMYVTADVGATEVVAGQLGLALFPRDPGTIAVAHGPQPTRLAGRVADQLDLLFVVLGVLSLLVASLGIANTSLVTVLERSREIGLRRALGIRRRDIGATFLLEAAMLGAVGGVAGASGGLVTIVLVAAPRDWTPVLDPWLPPAAVALGIGVGLLAGGYAASRAMRTEPIAALTRG